jgi:phosphoserine aminotransferase
MSNLASPALVIPAGLKPGDGRFGSGPARVRPAQLAALADSGPAYLGTSHRQPPVRSLVHRIRVGLAELFGLPAGYIVALGNGGTSAFWEMATFGLIREHSQHLSFGEFSARFAALAACAPAVRTGGDSVGPRQSPGRHGRPAGRRVRAHPQ